jgi:hypothetical protein
MWGTRRRAWTGAGISVTSKHAEMKTLRVIVVALVQVPITSAGTKTARRNAARIILAKAKTVKPFVVIRTKSADVRYPKLHVPRQVVRSSA